MIEYLEKNKVRAVYLPLIIYWLVLLTATSLPGKDLPNLGVSDKLEHFTAYFILAVILNLALIVQNKYSLLKLKSSIFTIIIIGSYAALDELHQLFIPGRSCDIKDWAADFIAACIGVSVIFLIRVKSRNKNIMT